LLTQGEDRVRPDPVAKYVTLKAYEKAGGPLRRDLFSDDDKKAYLLDAALLEKLATAKLQKSAPSRSQAEGWKWVDVRARYVFDEYVKYGELRKTRRAPSGEEAAAIASLQARSKRCMRRWMRCRTTKTATRTTTASSSSWKPRAKAWRHSCKALRGSPVRVAFRPDGPGRLRRPSSAAREPLR
jgi:hypothetical protein